MLKIILVSSFCLFCTSAVVAQKSDVSCSSVTYENHNQVDPAPLTVKNISGQVLDTPRTGKGQPISSVCIALFDEKRKEIISVKSADDKGRFSLRKVPNGEYRLVVKSMYNFYCVANIKLKIDDKASQKKRIVVHMRLGAIDECSYGELK